MKREFLEGLGLEKDVIDKIMGEAGKDLTTEQNVTKAVKGQLDVANKSIADLKADLKKFEGTQMVLTGHLKKHYKACLKCRSGKLKKGSIVFYFLKYGEAYHRGNCKAIDKYTVTLEKTQAESRGYTPCGKCGGI